MVDHIPPKPLQTIAWIVVFLLSISMAISACVGAYQESWRCGRGGRDNDRAAPSLGRKCPRRACLRQGPFPTRVRDRCSALSLTSDGLSPEHCGPVDCPLGRARPARPVELFDHYEAEVVGDGKGRSSGSHRKGAKGQT
jgi:hypothetical protein